MHLEDEIVAYHDDGVTRTPIYDSDVRARVAEMYPEGCKMPDLAYSIALVELKWPNALKLLEEN